MRAPSVLSCLPLMVTHSERRVSGMVSMDTSLSQAF